MDETPDAAGHRRPAVTRTPSFKTVSRSATEGEEPLTRPRELATVRIRDFEANHSRVARVTRRFRAGLNRNPRSRHPPRASRVCRAASGARAARRAPPARATRTAARAPRRWPGPTPAVAVVAKGVAPSPEGSNLARTRARFTGRHPGGEKPRRKPRAEERAHDESPGRAVAVRELSRSFFHDSVFCPAQGLCSYESLIADVAEATFHHTVTLRGCRRSAAGRCRRPPRPRWTST